MRNPTPKNHSAVKGKLLGLGGSPSFRALLAPRISRGHFFLANFFRVTHDGLSERGTTRSLYSRLVREIIIDCLRTFKETTADKRHGAAFLCRIWPKISQNRDG